MDVEKLHADALVIDGLVISNWSRQVFEDLHAGGVNAVNCTCWHFHNRGNGPIRG